MAMHSFVSSWFPRKNVVFGHCPSVRRKSPHVNRARVMWPVARELDIDNRYIRKMLDVSAERKYFHSRSYFKRTHKKQATLQWTTFGSKWYFLDEQKESYRNKMRAIWKASLQGVGRNFGSNDRLRSVVRKQYLQSCGTFEGILSNFDAICSNWETGLRSLALLLDDWLTILIDVVLLWIVVVILVVVSGDVELVLPFGLAIGRLKASDSDMWFLNLWLWSFFMDDGDGGRSYLLIFNDCFRDKAANSLSTRASQLLPLPPDTFDAFDFRGALRNCS